MPKKNKKVKKIKSKKKFKLISLKPEKVNYDKVRHETSVDQSDRQVPYNLRQSGPTKVEMLISTRVRKSPYWHLSCLLYTSPSPRDVSSSRMPSSA